MKKFLSILSVLSVGTLTATSVVACNNQPQPAKADNQVFLYHVAKNYNLGYIKKGEKEKQQEDILNAFKKLNPSIKDTTLTVEITDSNQRAVITVDKADPKLQGSETVIFHTSESKDIGQLIITKDIAVNRNPSSPLVPKINVTENDVINGINAANGLNLQLADFNIVFTDYHDKGRKDPSQATITAKPNNKEHYEGKLNLNINQSVKLNELVTNTNLGTIYLPQEQIDNINNTKYGWTISIQAFLMEYAGDANPVLQQFQDIIASVQFASEPEKIISFNKEHLTIDSTYQDKNSNPLSAYFTGKVTFNFTIKQDKRLSITNAIKTTNINVKPNATEDDIKETIIQQNKTQLDKFSSQDLHDYLIVTDYTLGATSVKVNWQPGSKEFLGHDQLAKDVSSPDVQTEIGDLKLTINLHYK